MNLSDYWQENKRFVTVVVSGALLFFIAFLMLNSNLGDKEAAVRKRISEANRDLRGGLYKAQDRDEAEQDNEALKAALESLSSQAVFEPREEFTLAGSKGSASNLYFLRVDEVREALRRLASRSRASLPEKLGLDDVMTNDVATIERHLMALDLIDRMVRHALASGVQSIDRIQVQLDPGFQSKDGVGQVERTSVRMEMSGASQAVASAVIASQGDRFGKPLVIDDLEAKTDRRETDKVTLALRMSAILLHPLRIEEDLE